MMITLVGLLLNIYNMSMFWDLTVVKSQNADMQTFRHYIFRHYPFISKCLRVCVWGFGEGVLECLSVCGFGVCGLGN